MNKMRNTLVLLSLILMNCSPKQEQSTKVNQLPMYGGIEKSKEQQQIDDDFIDACDKYFKDRNEATQHHIDKGWEYFYKNKLDTAMMRFNQAWLLDSLNADVYWGFGNILGQQQKFQESLKFFDKSLILNSKNAQVWLCSSISYSQLFHQSRDVSLLNKAIDNLKQTVALDSTNAIAYSQLTVGYSYFNQLDSAKKYLKIADRLDPSVVHPEVRQFLSDK